MEKFEVQHPVIVPLPCYICILCDIKFANQTDLDLHNQLHAGTSGFSCPLCKEILPDLHQLQLHDLQHSLAEAQEDCGSLSDFDIFAQPCASCICIICGEGFNSEEELTSHCAVHADVDNVGEGMGVERENGFMEPNLFQLSGTKIVLAKKSFQRPIRPCSRRPPAPYETNDSLEAVKLLFANSVQMEKQQLVYSVTEEELNSLTTENKVQTSAPKKRRRKSKFSSTSARNKCDQCKRIFSNSFSLKRHKSIIHLNKRPYACTFCRKTFIQMSMLTRHTLRHHASNDYIFTCQYCHEEFVEQEHLRQHVFTTHNMKYSCEACFKFFAEKEEHIQHMREHVTTFGFDCCRCKRRYKNDWELKRHRCIQEGPRPYLCKICGKRFNRKYHLTRHFSVHQTEEGSVGYGVKIECDSEGEIEQPLRLNPRKNKMIYTGRKADFMSHYKNGRKLMLIKKSKFQCYICNERWPNLRRYKQHFLMTHKGVRFNSCHLCGKQFGTAYKVRRHLSCHNIPEKTNENTDLKRPSASNFPLNSANEIAHSDQISASDLEDENELIQDRRGDHVCYICQQKCSNLRRLKLHFKSRHKGIEFNSCHLCSRQFPSAHKVMSHLTRFHASVKTEYLSDNLQENSQDYPSEVILYNNPTVAEFENSNTYGRGVRKTFMCYICKENCLSYRRYREHFHTAHKGINLNACHLCNKQFPTTSKVKRHLQSHTHERNFKCHACGKRFAQLSHLKRHRILMHTVKSYRLSKCMYCPKLYADKASFEKHIYMHQLAEQSNFKCTVCNEKFVEERLLDEHILAFHDFFKKYQCPTCRRRFSQQSYLNRHMVIHSALRKWKCFTCNKRFSTKSDLTRHSLTHTNLKPFPCFFCEKCFTRSSNRQKHISLFHNIRNVSVFDEETDVKPFQDLADKQELITFN